MFDRLLNATRSIFTFRSDRQLQGSKNQPVAESCSSSLDTDEPATTSMVATRSLSEQIETIVDIKETGGKRKRSDGVPKSEATHRKKRSLGPLDEGIGSLDGSRERTDATEFITRTPQNQPLPLRQHRLSNGRASFNGATTSAADEMNTASIESEAEDGPEDPDLRPEASTVGEISTGSTANGIDNHTGAKTHVRFDSEEPGPVPSDLDDVHAQPNGTNGASQNGGADSESDSDDAPETMTAAQSQNSMRASAAGVTKAVRSQESSRKDSRRKQDAKYKQQAKTSSLNQAKSNLAKDQSKPSTQTADSTASGVFDSDRMPEFLPAEILNAEPATEQPRATHKVKPDKQAQKKPDKTNSGLPADVIRSGRIVRVLDSTPASAAAEAASTSKGLRESWLAGKRARETLVADQRRALHKSFAKR